MFGSTLDKELISKILNKYSITHIYMSALKHVELCELNKINVYCIILSLRKFSSVIIEYKVKKFLLISTDKSINPTTIM